MDTGESQGIAQTVLGPMTSSDGLPEQEGFVLDPEQEACVSLDPETPAILLTAGAGTGKTDTLAARLARLLGLEKPTSPSTTVAMTTRRTTIVSNGVSMDTKRNQDDSQTLEYARMAKKSCTGSLDDPDTAAAVPRPEDGGIENGRGRGGGSGSGSDLGRGGKWQSRFCPAPPESVLVLSFSNQRAQDVRDRVVAMGLPRALGERIWATTFHAFAATVVKHNGDLIWSEPDKGKDRPTKNGHGTGAARFPIIGNEEQLSLVFQALKRVEDAAGSKVKKSFSGSNSNAVRGVDATAPGGTGDWSISAFGGSFGMPKAPLGRGGGQERGGGVEVRAKTLLSRVKRWKEQGLTPEDVRDRVSEMTDVVDHALAARVYHEYQLLLRSRRQADYGDLCMMATQLFISHPEVLARYRWKLRHVLVDEYQDTSPAQVQLLKALVLGNPSSLADSTREGIETRLDRHPGLGVSVFCAGDEDQHIYGWRGTTVDHLHSFEDDFPGAVRCTLTQTHRLPVHILRSATGLMRAGGLVPALNRRMKTKTNTGAVVRAQGLWNSREEGKWVALEASKIHRKEGISYSDMAVIMRTAYNTRELEESLASRGIPYIVEGGSSFFSRPEVQAPLALLALCVNPQDSDAFRHLVSCRSSAEGLLPWATPRIMQAMEERAASERVSIAEAVRISVTGGHHVEGAGGDVIDFICGLRRWSGLLMGWPKQLERERGAAVTNIFVEAGFIAPTNRELGKESSMREVPPVKGLSASGSVMTESRRDPKIVSKEQESVRKLAIAASRCDHVERFLLRAARSREEAWRTQAVRGRGGRGGRWEGPTGVGTKQREAEALIRSSEAAVELMTMHQAKGREFKVVFLTGWDEGSFPMLPESVVGAGGEHLVESLARVQEERRLGYVALTRAREHVIITFSKKRRFKDAWVQSAGPSRFLLEMPEDYVTVSPSTVERILNEYPGRAVCNSLTFSGLVREGKLRRSRPVLPSASEIDVYNSWLPLSLGVGTQGDDGSIVLRGGVDSTLPLGCTIINRSGSHLTTSGRDTKKSDRSASVVRNSSNSIVRSKLGTDGLGQVDGRTRSTGNPTNAAITHSLAGCLAEGAKFKERKKKQEKGGEVHLAAAGSEGLRGEMSAALAAENLGAKDDERGGIRPTVGAGSLPPLTQSQAVAPTREPRMTGVHSVEQAQHGGTVEAIKKKDRGTSSRKGHFRQALAAASALLDSFSTRNNRNRGATGSLASAQSANSLQPSEPLVQSATRSAGATARGAQASLTSQSIPSSMQAARERERLWEGGVTAVPRKLVQREDAARMAPLPAGHRGTDRRVAECRTAAQNFVNVQACTPSPIKGQVPGEQEEAHPRKSLEPCGRRENAYARQGKVTAPLTRSIPVASTTSRVAVPQSGEDSRVTLRLRRAVQQLALSSARSGRDIAKGAYNPGPTFHMSETCTGSRRRGRKKKVVLNASLVTAQDTVDEGKVLALVADPEIHQMSLKNYLRAVLAVQHGCVRGRIPMCRPHVTYGAHKGAMDGLETAKITRSVALSQSSVKELASHVITLLSAQNMRNKSRVRDQTR